jgi:hypothetical protein
MFKLNLQKKSMKKALTILFICVSCFSYSQDQTNKKFQVGFSYSLTNDSEIYKNPFSAYAAYQIKRWDAIDVNVGLRTFYFESSESDVFTNKLGYNPYLSGSYFFGKNKFNTYLAVGYYYDSSTFTPVDDPFYTGEEWDIKTNGVTVTPGIKYFVFSSIFIDANLSLLFAQSKYENVSTETVNNTFLNLGVGIAF